MVTASALLDAVRSVPDPELPMVTIDDLGILRDVSVHHDGSVAVTITPTYSGCPAMDAIAADIRTALEAQGVTSVLVKTELAPAWTSDWISAAGRRKLADAGIAPPGPAGGPVAVTISPRCPRCSSPDTRVVSRFGSTACKAIYVCQQCKEPFDHFKAI